MSAHELRDRAKTRPFVPFRMVLTEGTSREIRHPDQVAVTRGLALFGMGAEEKNIYESASWVSHLHIVRLEPLEPQTSTAGDGAAGT